MHAYYFGSPSLHLSIHIPISAYLLQYVQNVGLFERNEKRIGGTIDESVE